MTDVEQTPPRPQNGFDIGNDDEAGKTRPADIEQDMREMERRKRVDAIMSSKMFREELERIVDSAREGGTHGILQHLSDIVGIPQSRLGNVFKSNNCVVPINDIRGIESIGYTKGEKILRCKLASTFRLLDLFNWSQGDLGAQITARLKVDQEIFLVNPYGLLYNEITASSLNKVDMQGNVVEHGTTNFLINKNHFSLHSAVHAARPDIRCAIYIGCSPVVAVSSLRTGLLPLTKDACTLGEITTFPYTGALLDAEERDKLVRNLGPISKVLLLSNHGALCCGETIEEAFFAACRIIQACETQLQLLPVGLDNLVLIPEETRKIIYEQSRRPPDDLAKKFAAAASITEDETDKEAPATTNNKERVIGAAPKWRVGGAEFEALMRMLDNAGFRTGYIYRHPLIKSELPKPKNDVELPPAVSSLGYLLEEEEYFRSGLWKKGDLRKGGDRSKWLNSPNVYQKVEVLETGTPDPKKITKWVADGSPTHSTPVRIEDPLQFVPVGTTSKEFKRIQQQIKENRRADKISAGPQSHILEGVTWDEANRSLKDGTVTTAGDHVVLMGAASKGIIQRGFQHNAAVYKTPYAKNPFDHVTDDEINEYTRTVERKKKSIHGEYTDTDFSESEPLSSLQTSGGQKQTTTSTTAAAVSHSEPEDAAHQVLRIQTQQAPVPSQAEVVMSDASLDFINGERSHTATNRKPPTGRASIEQNLQFQEEEHAIVGEDEEEVVDNGAIKKSLTPSELDFKIYHDKLKRNKQLVSDMRNAVLFKRQQDKYCENAIVNENSQFIACEACVVNVKDGNLSTGVREHLKTNNMSENTNRKLGLQQPLPLPQSHSNSIYQAMPNDFIMMLKRANAQQHIDCLSNCSDSSTHKYYYESNPYCEQNYPYYDMADHPRYQVASNCLTPRKCQLIFESLHRAAKSEQAPWSTASTPCVNTPRNRRDRHMAAQVQYNPYRTVSHFGFNSPRQLLEPEHKHIPDDFTVSRYVPMRRSNSYEEIFSSRLHAELCEHCFARLLRLKPELQLVRTRLRNLADLPTTKSTNQQYESKETTDNVELNQYEYVEASPCAVNKDILPVSVTPILQTVDELDENRSSLETSQNSHHDNSMPQGLREQKEEKQQHVDDIGNNTFVDKIMSFNYSEESTNIHFEPPLTESILSIEAVRGDEAENKDNTHTLLASVKCERPKINILSVIDLGNWKERDAVQACQYKDPNAVKDVNTVDTHGNRNDDEQISKEVDSVDQMDDFSSGHTSMSRDERSRRKLEFQEIWEDHINFQSQQEEAEELTYMENTDSPGEDLEEVYRPDTPHYGDNYIMDPDIFLGCSLIMQNGNIKETHDACSQTCDMNNQNYNGHNEVIFAQATQYLRENENTMTYCIVSAINNTALTLVDLENGNLENINGNPEGTESVVIEEETESEEGTVVLETNNNDGGMAGDHENPLRLELVQVSNNEAVEVLTSDSNENTALYEISNATLYYDAQNCDEQLPVMLQSLSINSTNIETTMENTEVVQNRSQELFYAQNGEENHLPVDANTKSATKNDLEINEELEECVNKFESLAVDNEFVDISVQTSLCMLNWERSTQREAESMLNLKKLAGGNEAISLNPVECEILRRIEEYELKVKDKIFQEIDTSIRNKLTPESLLRKIRTAYAKEQETQELTTACERYLDEFLNEEEEKPTTSANARKLMLRRQLRSARDILDEAMSEVSATTTTNESDVQELNSKTESESEAEQNEEECEWNNLSTHTISSEDIQGGINLPRNGKFCTAKEFNFALTTGWSPLKNTTSAPEFRDKHQPTLQSTREKVTAKCERDFIRENIIRAGVPQRVVRRHKKSSAIRGNVSSIFGKNPFGPTPSKIIQKYPSMTAHNMINSAEQESSSRVYMQTSSTSSGDTKSKGAPPVYSFETQKHQRFWMSLSPTDRQKTLKANRNSIKNSYHKKSTPTQGGSVCKTSTPLSLRRKLFTEMPTDSGNQYDSKPCSPRLHNYPNNLCGKRKLKDVNSEILLKQSRVEESKNEEEEEKFESGDNQFDNDTDNDIDSENEKSDTNLTFTEEQFDAADNADDDTDD